MIEEPSLFDDEPSKSSGDATGADAGLDTVEAWFRSQRRLDARFGQVLRQSIDEVLDGQRTGRYDIDSKDVAKTEKTYLGTKVEIVARAEFDLGFGKPMDYLVAGHPVDAKFTMGTNWAIPKEAMGHICLVLRANDAKAFFQVGLIRITESVLNPGENRDGKRSIGATGRKAIRWLVPDGRLPENLLLGLRKTRPEAVDAIFHASDDYKGSGNGGQLRINELLRQVQDRLIDRTTAITVASQYDGPKRVRDAREHLRKDGIIVLGHLQPAPRIARELQLPVPHKGSWVAVKLATRPDDDQQRPFATIDGLDYVRWQEGDEPIEAPLIET